MHLPEFIEQQSEKLDHRDLISNNMSISGQQECPAGNSAYRTRLLTWLDPKMKREN